MSKVVVKTARRCVFRRRNNFPKLFRDSKGPFFFFVETKMALRNAFQVILLFGCTFSFLSGCTFFNFKNEFGGVYHYDTESPTNVTFIASKQDDKYCLSAQNGSPFPVSFGSFDGSSTVHVWVISGTFDALCFDSNLIQHPIIGFCEEGKNSTGIFGSCGLYKPVAYGSWTCNNPTIQEGSNEVTPCGLQVRLSGDYTMFTSQECQSYLSSHPH